MAVFQNTVRIAALGFFFVLRLLSGQVVSGDFDDLARRAEAAIETNPTEAADLYKQALGLRPDWAEGWLYRGAALFQLNRFAEARDALSKGAALEPNKGTPWAYLGMAEYELGDYKPALGDILKGESIGLADRPEFVAAVRYRAAMIDLRFFDYPEALEQLRPLARAGNDSPAIIQALGVTALSMNSLPGNVPADKRALVELAGRAAAAFLAEQANESKVLFDKLVAQFPDEPGVSYVYGVFLVDQDAGAAEAAFRKELRITPAHVLARVQLAMLLVKRGDTQQAEKFARQAVHLQPESAVCQVTLGRVLLKVGRTNEAIAALEKGEKIAPNASRTHFYLQQAYRRAGRIQEADRQKAEFNRLRAQQEPVLIGEP